MAKLIFVTGRTTSGKTQYVRKNMAPNAVVIDEAGYSRERLATIHDCLADGIDVYVSWILPEGTEIEWVPESKR